MKYYKGNTEVDRPEFGGSHVVETGEAHEDMNFYPIDIESSVDDSIKATGSYCHGFYETKATNGYKRNQTHVEKVNGCGAYKKEDKIEHILVVWCAKSRVVGWYINATVSRWYQGPDLEPLDRYYNISAKAEDCTLLPVETRYGSTWDVPRARKDGYGFGQANVWYPTAPEAEEYLEKLIENINHYKGENWVFECPEV